MKRIFLHLLFWVVYVCQDTALSYLWDAGTLGSHSEKAQIGMAIGNASIILIPKLLFTYFVLYVVLKKILRSGFDWRTALEYVVLPLAITLLLYRAIFVYIIFPHVYKGMLGNPEFFRPLSYLMALMDIGFASGAAITIKLVRLQLASKEHEKNLVKEKLETELKFLRNQTNPHFLFNTLNNIYALARKKSDDTAAVVMKLSQLLRFMLYESKKPQIRIGDELKMIDDYIELERIRYNGRLTIDFIREIDNDSEAIAPLILLPFIENAFKHGASESRFKSFIHIDMKLQQKILTFRIENTKEPAADIPVTENIGLGNVRRQLELMYRDHELQVHSEPALFKVALRINLKSHAKI